MTRSAEYRPEREDFLNPAIGRQYKAPKAEPVSVEQRIASDTGLKIAKDIHSEFEKLIYGLPDYLRAENLTDEEGVIREAQIVFDATAHRIAHLELAHAEALTVEQERHWIERYADGGGVDLLGYDVNAEDQAEWDAVHLRFTSGDGSTATRSYINARPASDELLAAAIETVAKFDATNSTPVRHSPLGINRLREAIAQHKGPQS